MTSEEIEKMLIADERDIAVELLLARERAAIEEVGRRIQLKSHENPGPKKAENWGPKTRPTHETENEGKEVTTTNSQRQFTVVDTEDITALMRHQLYVDTDVNARNYLVMLIHRMDYVNNAGNKNYNAELTRVLNRLLEKFGNSVVLLKFLRGCLLAFNNDTHVPSETELMVQLGLRKPYKPRHLKRDPFYVED